MCSVRGEGHRRRKRSCRPLSCLLAASIAFVAIQSVAPFLRSWPWSSTPDAISSNATSGRNGRNEELLDRHRQERTPQRSERAVANQPLRTKNVTTPGTNDLGTIPQRLWFTHKENILATKTPRHFYDNVQHTIARYRDAWNVSEVNATFLDDDMCAELVARAKSGLVRYFREEEQGKYRGDICRVAALYLHGGYYLDVDMEVIEPYTVKQHRANLSFVTVLSETNSSFFQSFLASAPRHPVLGKALDGMLDYYRGEFNLEGENWMGTVTLKQAYDAVPSDMRGATHLLQEVNLDVNTFLYPSLPRRDGEGCCCNYVVHDTELKEVYFYSRIVGTEFCQYKSEVHDEGSKSNRLLGESRSSSKVKLCLYFVHLLSSIGAILFCMEYRIPGISD